MRRMNLPSRRKCAGEGKHALRERARNGKSSVKGKVGC